MAAAAVKLAARIFPSLHDPNVLFIGAGEMIELCATHFAAQAPARITVANRTLERGQALAHRFSGRAIELRALAEHLHEYDIVVSCTASSLPILGKGLVERALSARATPPMFMVDLAVPRDIEAEVGELDDVFLYTLDDLQGVVQGNWTRALAVAQAEAIIETQVGQFMHWMDARASVPLIRRCASRREAARRHELERALRLLHGRGPEAGAGGAVAGAHQQAAARPDAGAERRRRPSGRSSASSSRGSSTSAPAVAERPRGDGQRRHGRPAPSPARSSETRIAAKLDSSRAAWKS